MREKGKGDCTKAHTVFLVLKTDEQKPHYENYHTRHSESTKIQDFQVVGVYYPLKSVFFSS